MILSHSHTWYLDDADLQCSRCGKLISWKVGRAGICFSSEPVEVVEKEGWFGRTRTYWRGRPEDTWICEPCIVEALLK